MQTDPYSNVFLFLYFYTQPDFGIVYFGFAAYLHYTVSLTFIFGLFPLPIMYCNCWTAISIGINEVLSHNILSYLSVLLIILT